MLRPLFGLLFIVASASGKAQIREIKNPKHEIMVISDNDNYTFNYSDRYYTNGLTLAYSYVGKKSDKLIEGYSSKVIRSVILGQHIYTPSDIDTELDQLYDRPYAGWLFIRYSTTRFLPNDITVDFGAELGLSGAYSLAEPIQKWWHGVVKYKQPQGWNKQIASGFGINFTSSASKGWRISKFLDLTSTTGLQFGTHFQNASQDLSLRIGAFNSLDYSAHKNSKLSLTKRSTCLKSTEHFLSAGVKLTSVLQNALIEGSSWPKQSPHQENVHPQFTTYQLGWVSSIKAYTIKIVWYRMSPEVIGGTDHKFVRLFLSHRF
ncbi:MAG: lipid A-modifier LpxR family protein [Cyclobacteriaceae bacterium]